MKIYHLVCFVLAFAESSMVFALGELGLSNLSTCLVHQTSPGVYVFYVIFCINIPILWIALFKVFINPISRKNKQLKYLLLVSTIKTISWGIPTFACVIPYNEEFNIAALLIACCSGIALCFSRLGLKHMPIIIRQIFYKTASIQRLIKSRRLHTGNTMVINEYIKEQLSIGTMLETIASDTTRSILTGISLIFFAESQPITENSYSYRKNKYFFSTKHVSTLEKTIGISTIETVEIWEYEPHVFKDIRQVLGWTDEKMRVSLCDKDNYKNIENANKAGRSSAFIFSTHNNKLILKTITKREKYLLLEILHKYQERTTNHFESRIVRILGLYKIRSNKQSFIIMENLLENKEKAIIFDLKGSTNDRYTDVEGDPRGIVLKDQNLDEMKIKTILDIHKTNEIIKAINEDILFLHELDIIDYSLIIAIYTESFDCDNRYFLEGNNHISYSIGIIDFLQQFTLSKRIELAYKKMRCKKNLSVCSPRKYAERFKLCILKLFENQ